MQASFKGTCGKFDDPNGSKRRVRGILLLRLLMPAKRPSLFEIYWLRGKDLNPRPPGYELYWLLSAGVHRVVKCSGFRLINDYYVRAHPPVFNAVAVKLAVNRYAQLLRARRAPRRPGVPDRR